MSNIIDQLLKMDASEIEVSKGVHKMYCKKLGKELEFEIEAIDAEKVAEIQEMSIDITKGEINSIDTYKLKVETIANGCKMFKNKELQKHFKALNHRELIKKLLLSGEMDSLNEAINNLNSVTELEGKEAKN